MPRIRDVRKKEQYTAACSFATSIVRYWNLGATMMGTLFLF